MNLSRRTALGVSLGVIFLYWGYQIVWQHSAPVLPAHFSDLVLRIVRGKLIVFAAVMLLLRLEGERFAALGVTRHQWPKHFGVGLAIGFAMFLGLNIALDSVMSSLLPRSPSAGPSILSFFKQPGNLLIWLPIGIFGGGVVEELQRIFILTRFEKWLGRPGLILGVVLSSALFGFGHLYQGVGTAISAAISGAVFALVYLRRRSALEPIVAHAFSDVLAMLGATMLAR
ncbi:MAG: CPBP family intramembrane metalloprotease [Candidatus Eisenbacteria bacterium]|nr:CPBP family intramembrane metalloprotease [Candidatus Eisenbacteria bacterium]